MNDRLRRVRSLSGSMAFGTGMVALTAGCPATGSRHVPAIFIRNRRGIMGRAAGIFNRVAGTIAASMCIRTMVAIMDTIPVGSETGDMDNDMGMDMGMGMGEITDPSSIKSASRSLSGAC